ncbi:hypothetical protein Tco_0832183 [Tanacetum coccineum]
MHRATDISMVLLISFYVSGLKPSLQRKLLVAKTTSLGDAFSLARVTEARLEDQGVTPPTCRSAVSSRSQTLTKKTPCITEMRLKNPKPPLLSMLVKVGNNSRAVPPPIKWLSPVERPDRLMMDTLSDVSEYLNNLEAYLDDGDSLETRMDKIEKSEEELEMFEALERKSVVVDVDGQGAWDAKLDMADSHNYITDEMLGKIRF